MAKMKILFITCLRVTGISQPIMFLFVHVTRGYHHGRNKPRELICSSSYICSPIVVFYLFLEFVSPMQPPYFWKTREPWD